MCQTVSRYIFCLIDVVVALNDEGEFERSCKDIFPSELELKMGNKTTQEGSMLDLYLKVSGRLNF